MSITYGNSITFNDFQLSSVTGFSVLSHDSYKPPKRTLSTANLVRTNKAKTHSGFYTEKYITIGYCINGNTRDEAELSLDTLNTNLQGLEKRLVVPMAGTQRWYTASLSANNLTVSGGSYIEGELVFELSDRYGYDYVLTTFLNLSGITAASRSDNYSFGGSAPWQAPVITITYTAMTGGTGKDVIIGNNSTGQQVTINRNWSSGDQLIVDVLNKVVTVNGSEVTTTGGLPEFAPGLGTITYYDNFTTRTFNYLGKYYKRYV